jgi:hypothetical protein
MTPNQSRLYFLEQRALKIGIMYYLTLWED